MTIMCRIYLSFIMVKNDLVVNESLTLIIARKDIIKKYKIRLVDKFLIQKEDIDYKYKFFLVLKKNSLEIALTLSAH